MFNNEGKSFERYPNSPFYERPDLNDLEYNKSEKQEKVSDIENETKGIIKKIFEKVFDVIKI